MAKAAKHLLSLVNAVLQISKLESGTEEFVCEPVHLSDISHDIIAMTANAFAEDAQKCLDADMNAHLAKPLEIKKAISVIAKFCR